VYNTGEARKYMATLIKNEMKDHIYLDLSEFFPAFFDSVDSLSRLVDDTFARCRRIRRYMHTNRWRRFPDSCEEHGIATWFQDEVRYIVESALHVDANCVHRVALNPQRVVSSPAQPVPGSTATRKLGVGFAALNRAGEPVSNYSWKDILVSGELKENDSDDTTPARGTIWEDMCARYITRRTLAASATASHCAGR
jgi:hypothetical protein